MASILQTMRAGAGTQHPQEIMNFFGSFLTLLGGVKDVNSTDFYVEAQGTPDMTVKVNMGNALIPTSDKKMAYPVRLYSAVYDQAVASNGSGNPRKDAIILYIDISATPNAAIDNVAKITRVQGTPAASPVAPTDGEIASAIGASNPFIRLADVTVASGATSITNSDIVDTRDDAELMLNSPRIKGQKQEYTTLADGATIQVDLRDGSKFQVTLGGNRAITLASPPSGKTWAGKTFMMRITQDATGNRSITSLFSGYTLKYADGVAFTLTPTANKTDKIGFEVLNDGLTIEVTVVSQNH